MKKVISVALFGLMMVGCTNSSKLVENQNNEIMMLQAQRAEIVARPTKNAKELLAKQAELKVINEMIEETLTVAERSQKMANDQTNNGVKGVLTGVGAVLGTAATIHSIAK